MISVLSFGFLYYYHLTEEGRWSWSLPATLTWTGCRDPTFSWSSAVGRNSRPNSELPNRWKEFCHSDLSDPPVTLSVHAHLPEQLGKFAYLEKVGSIVETLPWIPDLTLSTRAGQVEEDFLNMQTRLMSSELGLSSDLSVAIGFILETVVWNWRFLGHIDIKARKRKGTCNGSSRSSSRILSPKNQGCYFACFQKTHCWKKHPEEETNVLEPPHDEICFLPTSNDLWELRFPKKKLV